MMTDKGIMKTEAVFSSDRQKRYLLRKEWDSKKQKATIIMTNPSTADLLIMDYTTLYILNNLAKLDFGSVDIVNMVAKTTTKLDTKEDIILNVDNVEQIIKSAEKADKVIIAWGKIGENNKKIRVVQEKLLEKLKPFEDKLCIIASDTGELGFHPLAPQIRFTWHLIPFIMPENQDGNEKANEPQTTQEEKLQKTEQTI